MAPRQSCSVVVGARGSGRGRVCESEGLACLAGEQLYVGFLTWAAVMAHHEGLGSVGDERRAAGGVLEGAEAAEGDGGLAGRLVAPG